MNLTSVLRKHAVWVFGAYLTASVLAFWPRYLRDLGSVTHPMVHVHGVVLAAWLLMLVVQSALVRADNRSLHRLLGRASVVVAPLVVITIISAAHISLNRDVVPTPMRLAQFAIQCGSAVLFGTFWALAMIHRRDVARHARWMFCTVLTMTVPIFDRILAFYVAPRSNVLPMFPDGSRTLPFIHVVLLTLTVMDWRAGRRVGPFGLAWVGFLVSHSFAWLAHRSDSWAAVVGWIRGLPLS